MAPQIDHKLKSLIKTLRTEGFVLKGIPNGFRIKLEQGPDVDIYTLKSSPEHVRARLKTQVTDAEKRDQLVDAIQRRISRSLQAVADLKRFRLTKDMQGVFVYYAHLDLSRSPAEQETGPSSRQASPNEDWHMLEVSDVIVKDSTEEAVDASPTAAPAPEPRKTPETGEAKIEFPGFEESDEDMPSAEEAAEKLEPVDAKMLRQAMDTLCLPRSSNVRMVLTRLYRSAFDAGELSSAIRSEAPKISSSEDRMELQMIREMRSVDFLNPLIDILWHTLNRG
jgi:hypothetical protein